MPTLGEKAMRVSRLLLSKLTTGAAMALCMTAIAPAKAWDCSALPSHYALKEALISAQKQSNGGFGLEMWGAMVDRDGQVCAIAFTGSGPGAPWAGRRVILAAEGYNAQ